ncbi:MAG: thiamine biosynthesis protein [Proteobacteria bacterium]|nr:thiamine biosynthesis protein [Pseudomonadota bacterium]MBU1716304.1 thiamine biosynthesis protein [Pseudomonadota bacterium]
MSKKEVSAIALFSGGLDSILACRLIAAQGIKVKAVKFVSPFFDYSLLAEEEYAKEIRSKYGIDVCVRDVSVSYLEMLRAPAHGYGRNFNPCVDCKILLVSEARKMMAEFGASFLITGEVIGQRPMSQRLDTLRVIERDSGCDGILLRPLCAKNQKPTIPEIKGLVDREQLLDFSGRTRGPQIKLAESFGIVDFPTPAGGCSLTDPIRAKRVKWFFEEYEQVTVTDGRLLLTGRHFTLPSGSWLVMGRDEKENEKILQLAQPGDMVLQMRDWPGPSAVLRYSSSPDEIEIAVGLIKRYCKKGVERNLAVVLVAAAGQENNVVSISAPPLDDETVSSWIR